MVQLWMIGKIHLHKKQHDQIKLIKLTCWGLNWHNLFVSSVKIKYLIHVNKQTKTRYTVYIRGQFSNTIIFPWLFLQLCCLWLSNNKYMKASNIIPWMEMLLPSYFFLFIETINSNSNWRDWWWWWQPKAVCHWRSKKISKWG